MMYGTRTCTSVPDPYVFVLPVPDPHVFVPPVPDPHPDLSEYGSGSLPKCHGSSKLASIGIQNSSEDNNTLLKSLHV
jgi:hypothetical protein